MPITTKHTEALASNPVTDFVEAIGLRVPIYSLANEEVVWALEYGEMLQKVLSQNENDIFENARMGTESLRVTYDVFAKFVQARTGEIITGEQIAASRPNNDEQKELIAAVAKLCGLTETGAADPKAPAKRRTRTR